MMLKQDWWKWESRVTPKEEEGASFLIPDVILASAGHSRDQYNPDTNGMLRLWKYDHMVSFQP